MFARCFLGCALCCSAAIAIAGEIDDDILPLLKARCVRCHGPNQPKAKLDLSTAAGLARGGENGRVLQPGQLGQSTLWKRVLADEMPPGQPLNVAEKHLVRRWVASGAQGLPAVNDRTADHGAFRPIRRPDVPPLRATARVRTRIDAFIQSRLELAGLEFGSDAEPHAIVRRVCLDVTGLPPSPDNVEQFLSEYRADPDAAYERLIERVLSSSHFGERWGKHWLDAAGYADSNGYFSADTDRPLAYRYRDYVLRSLNADKPFDQFVREQLAGDELSQFRSGQPTSPQSIELVEATHFLRNGQDGTDIGVTEPEAFEIDRRAALEAVVQVTASSLLGITLHCARCHDHKFEPITQQEYYQFQAIMFPAFNPQNWINPKDRVVYAYLPGEKETWQQNEQRIKGELTQLRAEFAQWIAANREPSEVLLDEKFDDDAWKSRWNNTAPGDDKPGGTVTIGGAVPHAARVEAGALQVVAGEGEAWLSTTAAFDWTPPAKLAWIQVTFDLVDNKVGGGPAERIGYTIAAHDYDDSSPLDGGNLLVDGNPSISTSIYRDYPGTDSKVIGQIGRQGYVPGRNYGIRVTNVGDDKFRLDHLVDGLADGKSLELVAADLPDGGFAFFFCCNRSYVVDNVRIERSLAEPTVSIDVAALRQELDVRRKSYDQRRGQLEAQRTPEPGRAIAWVTDKSAEAPIVPLLTRNLYHLRGPTVEPATLSMLTDTGYEFRPQRPAADAPTTGRRSGLADWITRSEGRPAALLARVHANRIWRQYFGRGIVATTDNLGQSGSRASHPELLEELAAQLITSGWSQKALHREILRSTVYRQSSMPRSAGLAIDPDNRLWWRWPLRRLEAEVIRDAMLAASGQLDATFYGPYVATRQTTVGEVVVDPQTPGARRRSVYLQQRRSQTLSMLKVFDAPAIATVCTTRPSSTVPLQSLTLLNSDFAVSCGESFAIRVRRDAAESSADVVRRAWQLAVGRDPRPDEESLAVEFLATQRTQYPSEHSEARSLADLCQMLLASNAFLYLE